MAEQLQVVPIQGDGWIVDILWGQFNFVVDLFTRFAAYLTEGESGLRICLAALAPGPAVVEGLGPWFSHVESPPNQQCGGYHI